jgi:hypothetical protein
MPVPIRCVDRCLLPVAFHSPNKNPVSPGIPETGRYHPSSFSPWRESTRSLYRACPPRLTGHSVWELRGEFEVLSAAGSHHPGSLLAASDLYYSPSTLRISGFAMSLRAPLCPVNRVTPDPRDSWPSSPLAIPASGPVEDRRVREREPPAATPNAHSETGQPPRRSQPAHRAGRACAGSHPHQAPAWPAQPGPRRE